MISIVIPCYNEADVLRLTYQSVVEAAAQWQDTFELLFVDDGSTDATWSIIALLARQDPRVGGLRLSRNFGHQAALGAGLERASGDAVVVLDADLQDPPQLVSEMLARWREGYDVVYAQRNCRQGESIFKRVAGSLFYRLLEKVNTVSIPRDTGDFALLDARVVRLLAGFQEHAPFWRGLRSWTGFRQTAVRFDRPGRAAGKTKYTLRKLVHLASSGLLNFSEIPLRLALFAGSVSLLASSLAAAAGLVQWISGRAAAEWTVPPTALAMFFLGSIQLLCLGIMGEYLNRIYDEVRNRPRWIIETALGAAAAANTPAEATPRLKAG